MDEHKAAIIRTILACTSCDNYLRKFDQGQFTVSQLCQHFKKKYDTVYFHIAKLKTANLIEPINLGDTKAGKYKRLLFKITSEGRMALMEKGNLG